MRDRHTSTSGEKWKFSWNILAAEVDRMTRAYSIPVNIGTGTPADNVRVKAVPLATLQPSPSNAAGRVTFYVESRVRSPSQKHKKTSTKRKTKATHYRKLSKRSRRCQARRGLSTKGGGPFGVCCPRIARDTPREKNDRLQASR